MIQVGDFVEVIDDAVKGVVKSISNGTLFLEDNDGFELKYDIQDVVKIPNDGELNSQAISNFSVSQVIKEKETKKPNRSLKIKPKERNLPAMEVDLHIHHLTKSHRGMSNHDILNIQLNTAQGQLEFAMRKNIRKIVFIHGVGEGVLKTELKYLFSKYEGIKMYDADYQKYGMGATEIYIYQNASRF
ncbi:MAG: DNA mismatch repair protein MutS [Bacteroidetes bacterium MedPE-SWsnd-G2]|nr:MAG: DNA mismatch repair protein MutS [Bacteroidetes bacterium MedPE-SWsnd-G2]